MSKPATIISAAVAALLAIGLSRSFPRGGAANVEVSQPGQPQDEADTRRTDPPKRTPREELLLKQFMRAKLEASNQVLEGLVVDDFSLIARGADKLLKMSSAEKWRASNDAMYRHHSAEFRRIAKQLKEKAEKKQLDGAALAWTKATISCIECHQFVRNLMIARP